MHNGDNELINFILYKDYERYDIASDYKQGDVVWLDGVYYSYNNASPNSGKPVTDTDYWTAETSKPRIDTSLIVGMIILIFIKGSKQIIQKFSIEAATGFELIDTTNAATSEYLVELDEDATLNLKQGSVLAEIKIVEDVGTDVTRSGYKYTTIKNIPLEELTPGISEFIDVPIP